MTQAEFETTRGQAIELMRQLWTELNQVVMPAYQHQLEAAATLVQSLEPTVTSTAPDSRYRRWKHMANDMYHTIAICERAMLFIPNTGFPPEQGIRDTGGLSSRLTEVCREYRGLI